MVGEFDQNILYAHMRFSNNKIIVIIKKQRSLSWRGINEVLYFPEELRQLVMLVQALP